MFVQGHGKRSVIYKGHFHIRSENPMLYLWNCPGGFPDHIFIEFLRLHRISRFRKTRTVSLPAVCIQRKLGNKQKSSVHIF